MRRRWPVMTGSGRAAAVVLATVVATGVAGCGGQTNASTLRAALDGQRASVNGIATELGSALASAGPRPDALQADKFAALRDRAEQEAARIEGLSHPPRFNTPLRDLRSALVAVANGLSHLSTAATEHQIATARTEMRALRADEIALRQTFAAVALSLRTG